MNMHGPPAVVDVVIDENWMGDMRVVAKVPDAHRAAFWALMGAGPLADRLSAVLAAAHAHARCSAPPQEPEPTPQAPEPPPAQPPALDLEAMLRQAAAEQSTVAHHAFWGGPDYPPSGAPDFCGCVGCETYRRGRWYRWGQMWTAVAGLVLAAALGWCMGATDERLRQRREAAPVTSSAR